MQGFAHSGTINALIILSVTLSIAWALTRCVEQPFLRKSLFNRLSRKERSANEPA
jgi:peptidoglycan/LPS O-acetylase OafA/YrhL